MIRISSVGKLIAELQAYPDETPVLFGFDIGFDTGGKYHETYHLQTVKVMPPRNEQEKFRLIDGLPYAKVKENESHVMNVLAINIT